MTNEAVIKCTGCGNKVKLIFKRVNIPGKEHWEGACSCGVKNYLNRPGWDLPIFIKYRRDYLFKMTGYSRGYLSRVAMGKYPVKETFIMACCHTLGESEEELFGIK